MTELFYMNRMVLVASAQISKKKFQPCSFYCKFLGVEIRPNWPVWDNDMVRASNA